MSVLLGQFGVIIHTLGDKAKNAIPQVVHVGEIPIIRSIAARSVLKARHCNRTS